MDKKVSKANLSFESSVNIGETLAAYGIDSQKDGSTYRYTAKFITVLGLNNDIINVIGDIHDGFSGSPVFNQLGNVIGIVEGGESVSKRQDGQLNSFIISIDYIKRNYLKAFLSK